VSLGDTRHQPDSKNDDIFVAIGEGVLRACQRAFEQPQIADKMLLAGYRDQRSINFGNCLD
jgi:hypothetical protein